MAEPPVDLMAVWHGGSQSQVDVIVIHCTDPSAPFPIASQPDTAWGTLRYFAGQFGTPGGSAHYVTDTGHSLHALPENVVAYHAPPNQNTVGIEIGGRAAYTRAQWLDPQVWPAVTRAATIARGVAGRWHVPLVKLDPAGLLAGARGVCGHVDRSQAFHQSDHTDPGPGFPWDRFMALLLPPPPSPDFLESLMTTMTDAEKHQFLDDIHAIRTTLDTMNTRSFQERDAGGWDDTVLRAILAALKPGA